MAFWLRAGALAVCLIALAIPSWTAGQTRVDAVSDFRTFPLIDQDGKTISLRGFAGRTMVVHFMFTYCAAVCHTQVRSLRTVREALPAETKGRVQFVSISIDPEHDTPATLRRYAQANGIADADWSVATASPDVIDQLTKRLLAKREALPDGQFDHTVVVFLFDASGRLVQRYTGPVDAPRLTKEIGDVVRLFGSSTSR